MFLIYCTVVAPAASVAVDTVISLACETITGHVAAAAAADLSLLTV